jgi:nicotinamidase-related amidase
MGTEDGKERTTGSVDLRLPDELRRLLHEHIDHLRQCYAKRGWGGRVGFGKRPAVVVIDLALAWTMERGPIGSNLDSVVEATCRVLEAARTTNVPIFFTTGHYDPADPPSPGSKKLATGPRPDFPIEEQFRLDPRLNRQPTERIIAKPYASTFKGTNFQEMLTALGVDTLIVTGCSTSHCVYATCRDARDSFHVIVPREAVGERCELMHEVNLLDIDLDLGDVMPVEAVVTWLEGLKVKPAAMA